mgnify:CR=1 FL=1
MDYDILVNKKYGLPYDYIPSDLIEIDKTYSIKGLAKKDAADAFIKMAKDAAKLNLYIINESSYRSYDRQKELYEIEYNKKGIDASRSIAIPGHSEHQTGLAFDICTKDNDMYNIENTDEFTWLSKHAYEYGFILRYPKGKELLTGYIYEPWHFRYLGPNLAKKVIDSNLTYDEYYEKIKRP